MSAKDWLAKAIDEIATEVYETSGPGTGIHVDEMRAIFDKHCPFKTDVAYIPVPRCDSCAHWTGMPSYWGSCKQLVITTPPDFGCVQWRAHA